MRGLLLILLLLISSISISQPKLPSPDHIVIVILENHSYDQIIGSPDAPNINKLANSSNTALFTQSYALYNPSQPNYFCFFSGSNQGSIDDKRPSDIPFTTPNLGRLLINSGRTYISYAEDFPTTGYDKDSIGYYVRRHNPATFWIGNGPNQLPASVLKSASDFPSNYNLLPTVSYFIPNNHNNMHTGNIYDGDKMFYDFLSPYIEWAKTHNSLFILTFDEDNLRQNNQIVTIFSGEMVKAGKYSQKINHYSVLRTIEQMYGLPYLANTATAEPITACWQLVSDSSNIQQSNDMTVYHNPSDHSITIQLGEKTQLTDLKFSIENTLGEIVKETAVHSTQSVISVTGFSSGIYVYQLFRNKEILHTGKIWVR